ncbi:hypothetical protein MKW92_039294 [Papaver armeniacum]|nr:hypothetical protein MKW92_039294 [Papaver armeniacum]
MYDPVVIASGQTFERMWIENWFSEGHDLCPKTEQQLPHFSIVPNSVMKDLISKWCMKHEISIQNPCSNPIPAILLSWNSSSSCSITSLGCSFSDVQMPTPTDLSYVSVGSSDVSWVSDISDFPRSKIVDSVSLDLFHVLASVAEEALAIMEVLSADEYCNSKIVASGALPTILHILDSDMTKYYAPTVRILHNLSLYGDIRFHILQIARLSKVVSFLSDSSLAEHCLKILNYLCKTEEGRIAVAETKGCINSIAELLEIGTHEQQEQALSVVLSLCSHHFKNSQLVLKEGVIPSLVNISVNRNSHGNETAMKLLQLFRDILHNDTIERNTLLSTGTQSEYQAVSSTCSAEKRSSSKTTGYFGRKIMRFRKPKSVALD